MVLRGRSGDPVTETRTSLNPRTALERTAWPEVDPSFLDAISAHAEERTFADGDVVFEVGQPTYDFLYIEQGAVDVLDRADGRAVVSLEAGTFLGELGMLMGQGAFMAGIARGGLKARVVPRDVFTELVATVPAIGDVVIPAFIARRRLLVDWHEGGLIIAGSMQDRRTVRLLEFVERSGIPHRWCELADLPGSIDHPGDRPVAVVGDSRVLLAPTPRHLAVAIGFDLRADASDIFDVVVVGAGPAGLGAAVYATSEGLCTLVIEDTAIGGQAGTSSRIENYLGFPTGLSGAELARRGAAQAFKFGAKLTVPRRATSLVRGDDGLFHVVLDDERCVRTRSVVLATGLQYRRLPIDGLEDYEGQGVYYAATDLEARLCRDSEAVVVGGGNSAGQAAMFLSRYASRVHLVVRRDGLSETMSSYLSDRILPHERIELHTRSEVVDVGGSDGALQRVTLRDADGRTRTLHASALFIMIGAVASTDWVGDLVTRDPNGMVITGRDARADARPYETSEPGVFAVGDVRAGSVKRVASAVGEGSVVISAIHAHLTEAVAS